jgi:hypothetical protein
LKAEVSLPFPTNNIQDIQVQNHQNYTNINVWGNESEGSTNGERAANQRDLHTTNRKQVLLGGGKEKGRIRNI